jgi:ATP-dependent exoDNAse (exonuclease V) alpha subunit
MGVIKSFESGNSCSFSWRRQNDRSWKYEWQNIRYKIDPATKEIEEEVLGTFVHYPIKLAWAITVHKSQVDFDKAAIDVSQVLCLVRPMLHYRVCAR